MRLSIINQLSIEVDHMAERIFGSNESEMDDDSITIRLSKDESAALYKLLSEMSQNDMVGRGLTEAQAYQASLVTHVLY